LSAACAVAADATLLLLLPAGLQELTELCAENLTAAGLASFTQLTSLLLLCCCGGCCCLQACSS
jgi:hypothetical protein